MLAVYLAKCFWESLLLLLGVAGPLHCRPGSHWMDAAVFHVQSGHLWVVSSGAVTDKAALTVHVTFCGRVRLLLG